MKCTKCGTESVSDAAFCSECGAAMASPAPAAAPAATPTAPPQPVRPQPAPAYPAPPAYQQAPPYVPKVPTVKNVHLGEILFVLSGLLLIAVGFENLGVGGFGLQYLVLGILAVIGGLYFLATVLMPHLLRELSQVSGVLTLALSLVFLLWGLAAAFGSNVGVAGGLLVAAGFAALLSGLMREGLIR